MAKDAQQVEVVWPGKYLADGSRRPYVPLVAPVDGQPAWQLGARDAAVEIHRGDNLAVLPTLEAGVKLIYLDPPYGLGRNHVGRIRINGEVHDLACYSDSWGSGEASFAHFLWLRLKACHQLLANDGSIFLHVNSANALLAEALLNDVFGTGHLLNRIIWHYTGGARARRNFANKYDVIFWYRKGKDYTFNPDAIREPYAASSGYAKSGIRAKSGRHYAPHPDGTVPDDVWHIPIINPMAAERCGYATQKPLVLLERIVRAASDAGDVVLDPCCGSGTTLLAAAGLGRRAIGIDCEALACEMTRRRARDSGLAVALNVHQSDSFPGLVVEKGGRLIFEADQPWRGIKQFELLVEVSQTPAQNARGARSEETSYLLSVEAGFVGLMAQQPTSGMRLELF